MTTADLERAALAAASMLEYADHHEECPVRGALSWDDGEAAINAGGCTCGFAALASRIESMLESVSSPTVSHEIVEAIVPSASELTFETITNDQIRELRQDARREIERLIDIKNACTDALTPRAGQMIARGRCAEILNARARK